jgi:hypothetical protein
VKKVLGVAVLLLSATTTQAEITPNDPLPTHILTCGGSVITDIGNRLEGNAGPASTVVYKNGGMQVSWDKIPAIINSKKGDHVLICLVYFPEKCPKGDERGKIYTTTNLRTLESWTVQDSEHSCGGA